MSHVGTKIYWAEQRCKNMGEVLDALHTFSEYPVTINDLKEHVTLSARAIRARVKLLENAGYVRIDRVPMRGGWTMHLYPTEKTELEPPWRVS